MAIEKIVFYVFSFGAILSAISVILSKNSVRAVLSLILTFFLSAITWIILEAEFLAFTLILVYVGAVMVLFLFVVMMLDIEKATVTSKFARYLPIGMVVAGAFIITLLAGLGPKYFGLEVFKYVSLPENYNNAKELGTILFTKYLYPFELAGILLLVAIVAAISLTFRGKHRSKGQNPNEQVRVKKADRLRIVKMGSN